MHEYVIEKCLEATYFWTLFRFPISLVMPLHNHSSFGPSLQLAGFVFGPFEIVHFSGAPNHER